MLIGQARTGHRANRASRPQSWLMQGSETPRPQTGTSPCPVDDRATQATQATRKVSGYHGLDRAYSDRGVCSPPTMWPWLCLPSQLDHLANHAILSAVHGAGATGVLHREWLSFHIYKWVITLLLISSRSASGEETQAESCRM